MEVKQVYVAPFTVSGLQVRTRNSPELTAETAKFATDFEAYTGPESVAVHIGIV